MLRDAQVKNAQHRPPLFSDRSFWGIISTQFLGAFNDNLYKQLMLLLALPVALAADAATADVTVGQVTEQADVQGWAAAIFALPFVLFSGFAGYLSDRYSKTPIIVWCKYAEIAIMGLGLLAFQMYGLFGQTGTWIVLFLMATQSSFFGPGKYGILPELFAHHDLARANALMLMSTFLAIILGTVAAGLLKQMMGGHSAEQLVSGLAICILIAIVGTLTARMIRLTPPANPQLRLSLDCWGVSRDMLALFRQDRTLLAAIMVSSVFWLVSGLAVPTVNRLGMEQLAVGEFKTSILVAGVGLGIMFGSPLASSICRSRLGNSAVNIGLGGIFVSLALLGMWSGQHHVLGYWGSLIGLISVGVFAAIFSIPVMVFLQSRPPMRLKGRLIATMNQANFVGILLAGPLYQLFEWLAGTVQCPISSVFWMMGALVLPFALFYRLDTRTPSDLAAVEN
ncbi:MAG: MFS transporter [Pirellulaceae bacterium]|nr:MFS transporter [Pirellulaceae bacterium]